MKESEEESETLRKTTAMESQVDHFPDSVVVEENLRLVRLSNGRLTKCREVCGSGYTYSLYNQGALLLSICTYSVMFTGTVTSR